MSRLLLFAGLAVTLTFMALVGGAPPATPQGALPTPQVLLTAPTPAVTPAPALAFAPVTSADGSLTMTSKLSNTYVAAGTSEEFLEVNLAAAESTERGPRLPVNLAVVIDRSGSMAGQKLDEARTAARELVEQLTPVDRLAIVHFGSTVETFSSEAGTPTGKARMLAFIDTIRDDGGTNLSGGLEAAQQAVAPFAREYKSTRIILLSDGQPTEGVTDDAGLHLRVARLREAGSTVSALGVGVDFNGPLMQDLARAGAGFYGFIDDASRLADVFRRELDEASRAVARAVALEVELPAGVSLVEVYGRTPEQHGTFYSVPLYDFSPGQTARVTARLRVRSTAPVGAQVQVARVTLRYADLKKETQVTSRGALLATVSNDPSRVQAMDAEVALNAHRSQSAAQLKLAAAAFERGDRAQAFGVLDNLRSMFGMSADSLAGEDLDALQARWERTTDAQAIRYEAKSLEKKGLKNFGENNAY